MSRQSLLAEARNKKLLAAEARTLAMQFTDKDYAQSFLEYAQELKDQANLLEANAAELPAPFSLKLWLKLTA